MRSVMARRPLRIATPDHACRDCSGSGEAALWCGMSVDAIGLQELIERELVQVTDARVVAHICGLLVEPKLMMRDWAYGEPGQQYPCWTVFEHDASDTTIVYCESGFGPRCPWGLVWSGDEKRKYFPMGMDSGWYPRFLDAYFESFAATELPIWRVFRTDASGTRELLTEEGSWEAAWQQVYARRGADPACRYDCDHSVAYGR